MGFKKGRQYATTWLKRAQHGSLTIGGIRYEDEDCCVEALKRDPEYAEAWCGLGSEITKMDASEDTDKTLAGMDLFKDEPKITDNLDNLHRTQINAAVFCFNKALEIEPKNVDIWYQKGSWHKSWTQSVKEQIECFLEVTKLDPKHKTAWYDLANAYSSWSEYAKAFNCYNKAIALSPDNLHVMYAKKADLLSKCAKTKRVQFKATSKSPARNILPKDALKCYDKALKIEPTYGYALYKKGMLLKQLSRYEEALECFENNGGYDRENGVPVMNSNKLHRLALRDKLKPHEAGSTESFEIYCNVLENFFKDDELSEVEYARKKLNENILQRIHKLGDDVTEEDVYEMAEWLQNTDREKEAFEFYDKVVEKSLEKGDLYDACEYNDQKARCLKYIGRTKDAFDCYEKTIQFCEKSTGSFDCHDCIGSGYSQHHDVAELLAGAYVANANTFKDFGNMDKAIEYIDHAIKLEREYGSDNLDDWWRKKVSWLPDEEAIKFLDEEIKAWQNSSYYDGDDKKYYIDGMKHRKNELLKDLKSNT